MGSPASSPHIDPLFPLCYDKSRTTGPYCFRPFTEYCEIVRELPEACVLVGMLHDVGMDVVPANDLETNCARDSHNKSMENREVWVDSNDSCVIYVYHHMYWSQGDHPAWVVCPLWE